MRWTVHLRDGEIEDVGADFSRVEGGALVFFDRVNLITTPATEDEKRAGLSGAYQSGQLVPTVAYAAGTWRFTTLDDRDGIYEGARP